MQIREVKNIRYKNSPEKDLIVSCSDLHKLMTKPTGKSPKEQYLAVIDSIDKKTKRADGMNPETKTAIKLRAEITELKKEARRLKPLQDTVLLSETCKSWIKGIAFNAVYDLNPQLDNKYVNKGNAVESDAINLLNDAEFESFEKNEARRAAILDGHRWLTGECDIDSGSEIIDIKSSWSLGTFPAYQEDADKKARESGYIDQVRGYMYLWDRNAGRVCYCIVDTPPELLRDGDDWDLHEVSHLEPGKRVTSVVVTRCEDWEKELVARYKAAAIYYKQCLTKLNNK